ncbi:MAG TPA: YCF48-related protein [Blastocatellia bacterium]|nr:YCF48-related protein [Blastocatellia bacterium]
MRITGRSLWLIYIALTVLAQMGCKPSAQNSNQANTSGPPKPVKVGKWVNQFRSPASLPYSGTHLALFSYSSISVVSPEVVFVAGDVPNVPKNENERIGVVVRTTDGGKTWTEFFIKQPGMKITTLNGVHFVNPNLGWVVGIDSKGGGVVLKTTDAGANWTVSQLNFKQQPTAVYFADEHTGWMGGATALADDEEEIGGPSDILATTDGGATWYPQRRVPTSINKFTFIDKQTGWAGGHKGAIYHTEDGGRTWNAQKSELEVSEGPLHQTPEGHLMFSIQGIHFVDRENGFAAASSQTGDDKGRMLKTTNGGQSWARTWIVEDSGVQDVFFLTPMIGWAATERGRYIYYSEDGGKYWNAEVVDFEQNVPVLRIAAADAAHVWAVGGGGIFVRVVEE